MNLKNELDRKFTDHSWKLQQKRHAKLGEDFKVLPKKNIDRRKSLTVQITEPTNFDHQNWPEPPRPVRNQYHGEEQELNHHNYENIQGHQNQVDEIFSQSPWKDNVNSNTRQSKSLKFAIRNENLPKYYRQNSFCGKSSTKYNLDRTGDNHYEIKHHSLKRSNTIGCTPLVTNFNKGYLPDTGCVEIGRVTNLIFYDSEKLTN